MDYIGVLKPSKLVPIILGQPASRSVQLCQVKDLFQIHRKPIMDALEATTS